ncbi:hypothetical protein V6N13_006217 [Hibiscus sabdariffa]
MAQTSAYMARTDRFIEKTDAFMDRTEMKLQNHDATLKSLETQEWKKSGPTNTQTGRAANPPAATDAPAKADGTTKADEAHQDPSDTYMGESSAESSQAKPDKLEEIKPPPPFPQG